MRVRVLGASRVDGDDGPVELGARKPRTILAALALRLDTDVTADALVDLVWGDDAPRGAYGTLHSYISGLRRTLEPGLAPREKPTVLLTADAGYRLHLPRAEVDATWFADEVRRSQRALAPLASQLSTGPAADWPDAATVAEHVERLETALGTWRGAAYADLLDHPDVLAERTALEQLRSGAEDDRALGLLALGEHATAVAATEQAAARDPLRERTRALHALALARSGRQADALAALRDVRSLLADELGLDPGQELRDLEQALLRQDQGPLQWLRRTVAPAAPVAAPAPTGPEPAPGRTTSTVGRDRERAALERLLDDAAAGTPGFGVLVGEAGIGKSRLLDDLVATARERGFCVAVGRCSSDDGAPALWPWQALLAGLARDGEEPVDVRLLQQQLDDAETVQGRAFSTWALLGDTVRARAQHDPVLLVVEDLHWADTPTLRALSALAEAAAPGQRIALAVSRRPWPAPSGALGELLELLARRHAPQLELGGLEPAEARDLVAGVTGTDPGDDVVDRWHARSGGNPFFLVELARLGGDGQDLPTSVRQVLLRRLETVPDETRDLLLLAAVLGREFSLDVLAAIAGKDPEATDLALAAARAAGIVRDLEAGVLAFDHALTRDAVAGSVPPTRLARLHAQVAHAIDADEQVAALVHPRERVAELARHWLAAGPTHTGRAWRAAAAAADQARSDADHPGAVALLTAAVEAHRRDPAGRREELFDLLLRRARDAQLGADWHVVVDCVVEAIALGRTEGDPFLVARAASELTRHSVWSVHEYGEVFPDVIDDLRWALAHVDPSDAPARAVLMLVLALELYYDPTGQAEAEALVDEGLRIARGTDDPVVAWWAANTAWLALWRPVHAERRRELALESLAAADRTEAGPGRDDRRAVSLTMLAGILLELGDVAGYDVRAREAEAVARRRRLIYIDVALGLVEVTLAAMREQPERATLYGEKVLRGSAYAAIPGREMHGFGVLTGQLTWTPGISQLLDPMWQATGGGQDEMTRGGVLTVAARSGRVDLLRDADERLHLAEAYAGWTPNWTAGPLFAGLAETAAALDDVTLARTAAAGLEPMAGRLAIYGISVCMGPIDAYLALALAVQGDTARATVVADRAAAQAVEWDLPAVTRWLAGHREARGF
ncbi:DUF2791 family P-loop domain-containing protein [Nocardioides KLBMP 9356]|uniref:DUF2791 family P-loop domain-containing protein n=1 Tax=Nocardioides potassii TaxID=2911371 RepID=A0ABS9H9P3_9ACTN|nr:BREX system ATP-binding domain-containing protein [Nocardioides potassii]MCF6377940.1 DUF2791 family P-loop domain-containing protein [Nocardioides potassii]